MPLTDAAIRSLKPRDKQYKVADEKGLYLLVTPAGGRLWKLKFRVPAGQEKKLSLGSYPEISLKAARDLRDSSRSLLASGVDPAEKKRRDKQVARFNMGNSFVSVADRLIEKQENEGLAEATITKRRWFVRLLSASLGSRPLVDIQPADILDALRPIEVKGRLETARRALNFVSQVYRYAVALQLAPSDPTRDLRGALTMPKPKHHSAILDPGKVGALLRAIDSYEGQPITRIALQLSPHVFTRPGELRRAEWRELDLEGAIWRIPPEKMKMRQEHVVPLSRQAVARFREAYKFTGLGRYVFPSIRSGANPMSENAVNAALRRLGYSSDEMTAHGFRAMASTLLN